MKMIVGILWFKIQLNIQLKIQRHLFINRLSFKFLFILFQLNSLFLFFDAHAESRSGFLDHQEENQIFDQVREEGQRADIEEKEQWELKRLSGLKEIHEYRTKDEGNQDLFAYHDWLAQKITDYYEYLSLEKNYEMKRRRMEEEKIEQNEDALDPMEEYTLRESRPRYDYSKRALYGAKSKKQNQLDGNVLGGSGGFGGSGSSGSSVPSFGGGFEDSDNFSPPPPPPPPPNYYEDNDNFPPPPPPPSFDGDDGF